MTLIAAWITDDFRIVASDSKTTGPNRVQTKGCPQKIFASDKIAIGLYGDFGFRMIQFKQKLVTKKIIQDNWDCEKLKSELNETLENEYLNRYKFDIDFHEEHESKVLVVPFKEEPKVLRIQFHKIQEEFALCEYKKTHQIEELVDLFFSEQVLSNQKIDYEHQRNLLNHFEKLNKFNTKELEIEIDVPSEVKVLIKLVLDAMDKNQKLLNKSNIGGNKVYYAYSYGGNAWKQDFYLKRDNKR